MLLDPAGAGAAPLALLCMDKVSSLVLLMTIYLEPLPYRNAI